MYSGFFEHCPCSAHFSQLASSSTHALAVGFVGVHESHVPQLSGHDCDIKTGFRVHSPRSDHCGHAIDSSAHGGRGSALRLAAKGARAVAAVQD
jgi:hypothetical protein